MNLDSDNASTEESNCCVFDELDAEITSNEVEKVINLLKRSKSHGLDLLLNEYFIELCDFLLPFIVEIFNAVLENGHFPKSWCEAIVIPVYKNKGNIDFTNNYRGISLLSNLAKLFTAVLNQRLLKWACENDIISDAQFGFRQSHGTADAIFCIAFSYK